MAEPDKSPEAVTGITPQAAAMTRLLEATMRLSDFAKKPHLEYETIVGEVDAALAHVRALHADTDGKDEFEDIQRALKSHQVILDAVKEIRENLAALTPSQIRLKDSLLIAKERLESLREKSDISRLEEEYRKKLSDYISWSLDVYVTSLEVENIFLAYKELFGERGAKTYVRKHTTRNNFLNDMVDCFDEAKGHSDDRSEEDLTPYAERLQRILAIGIETEFLREEDRDVQKILRAMNTLCRDAQRRARRRQE